MTEPSERPVVAVLSASPDKPWPGLEPLASEAELRRVYVADELRAALRGADVLVVTDFNSQLLREAWPEDASVRWIHATSTGVDAVLVPPVVDSDIPVTNARGIFDAAIAEYVLGLVILFAKDFHGTLAHQQARRWVHRDSERIAGRRALIVGAGSIGGAIARQLHAAGLHVEGVARTARHDENFAAVYANNELHAQLGNADFVVLSCPLTEETAGLFDTKAFAAMQPSARLINIGRGEVVVHDDLVAALAAGQIAGVALDVFDREPLPADDPLWDMPQALVSPHMAGDFLGWREALSQQFIENFQRWRSGGPLCNVIDKRRGYGLLEDPSA